MQQRIVSLVPSLTELLYDLGLGDEVVGITKFCVHPRKWLKEKRRVGGTKNVNISLVQALRPSLIIANEEENVKEHVKELAKDFPVLLTNIKTVVGAIDAIAEIGNAVGRREKAGEICAAIKEDFGEFKDQFSDISVAYVIWNNPIMTIGGDTYISDVLAQAGMQNCFGNSLRYPITTFQDLHSLKPDYVLLSSEPFPFKEKHLEAWQRNLPGIEIRLIDGEMCSWYGSRMLQAADYLKAFRQRLA